MLLQNVPKSVSDFRPTIQYLGVDVLSKFYWSETLFAKIVCATCGCFIHQIIWKCSLKSLASTQIGPLYRSHYRTVTLLWHKKHLHIRTQQRANQRILSYRGNRYHYPAELLFGWIGFKQCYYYLTKATQVKKEVSLCKWILPGQTPPVSFAIAVTFPNTNSLFSVNLLIF